MRVYMSYFRNAAHHSRLRMASGLSLPHLISSLMTGDVSLAAHPSPSSRGYFYVLEGQPEERATSWNQAAVVRVDVDEGEVGFDVL